MAAVPEYLKKLLYQYDCVVVPELGAFLTHHQSACFTESSGLYLPPRRRVAFNEALRLDDGILANYIMLHEPVTREGAQRHIGAFVRELQQQVQTAGRFEIESIGTFTRNDEGRLQFDPSLRQNFFGEAYGMSALSAQLVVPTPVIEPSLEARPVPAPGPVRVPDDAVLTPMPRSRPYWRVAAAALLVGSLGVVSYFSVIDPGQPLQSSLNPANLFRLPAVTSERIAATVAKPKAVVPPVNKPVDNRVAAPAPTVVPVAVKSTPVAAAPIPTAVDKPAVVPVRKPIVPNAAPVAVAKPVRTGPMFTIFAGSFASKRNAVNLQRRLRRAGYADAYIIPPIVTGPPVRRKLYKVAAAGTTAPDQAVALQAAISKFAGAPAFVLAH